VFAFVHAIWVRWELGVVVRGRSIQYGVVGLYCCGWLCQWFLEWVVGGARCHCSHVCGCHGHGRFAWEGHLAVGVGDCARRKWKGERKEYLVVFYK